MKLKSRVKIEVYGLNHARLIDKLRLAANLSEVRLWQKKFSFVVDSKDKQKILAILNQLCYNYKIIEESGFSNFLKTLFNRYGILIGMFITVIFIILGSGIVLKVDVNEPEYKKQVEKILASQNMKVFTFQYDNDFQKIESKLLKMKGVSFAKVEKNGAVLNVFLKKELPPPKYVFLEGKPVVSNKKAVITRIVVLSGTAAVQYGDVVKPGDVLIEGKQLIGEEEVEVVPNGEVFGKVQIQSEYKYEKKHWKNVKLKKDKMLYTSMVSALSQSMEGQLTNYWGEVKESGDFYVVTITLENEVKLGGKF